MFLARPIKHKCTYIGMLTILASILFEGCATFQPQTMTCETLGSVRISSEDARNGRKLFSVLPPSKTNWCELGTWYPNLIVYGTNKLMGQYLEKAPAREDLQHSFVIEVKAVRVYSVDISSPLALKNFMERWFFEGARSFSRISGEFHPKFTSVEGNEPISMHNEFDNSFGANCVRFESLSEITDNSWTFDLKSNGVACQHPNIPSLLVDVEFSERHKKGLENPQLTNRIRTEAERTINSLEFGDMQ